MKSKQKQQSLKLHNKKTLLQLKNKLGRAKKIAFLGIGHPLRGDDAAGLFFIKTLLKNLKQKLPSLKHQLSLFKEIKFHNNSSWLLIEGGASPENYTGLLRYFKADLLIVIDAANIQSISGTIKMVPHDKTASIYSSSTHRLPPNLLVKYLSIDNQDMKTIWLLIQPKNISLLSQKISKEVRDSITSLSNLLMDVVCLQNHHISHKKQEG